MSAWLLALVLLGPPPPRVDTGLRDSPSGIMQQLSRHAAPWRRRI